MTKVFSAIGRKDEGKFKDARVPTLSEWCVQNAKRPLEGGEVIEADNIRVVVRKFRRKKVSEVLVG